MSYQQNKDNSREYINRTNSNANKMPSMGNRNINMSQQYSNSNNGDSYSYEMKAQRGSNSPKQIGEIHNNNQQNSGPRDHYQYKSDNSRNRHYAGKYSNERSNYSNYNHPPSSPTEIQIPDIDQLKDFIREQTDLFKIELSKYEGRKSCSPSPRTNYHQDQGQQRSQQRPPIGQNRIIPGMSTSNSLGTITTSNSNFSGAQSFASTAMSNIDKQSNSYSNKCNYNKPVQSSSKSNHLMRNLSHDDSYSKAPPLNKNRVGSPNNANEKSPGNKTQFTASSNGGGVRQDNKSDMNKPNKYAQFTFNPGNSYANQQNSNNSFSSNSYVNKTNQQMRQNSGSGSSNYKNFNSNAAYDAPKNSNKVNGDNESIKPHRAEVHIPSENARHISNSGNTTDSQDVEYGTPDSPASPCSLRSSQTDDNNRAGPGAVRPGKDHLRK